jgi:hypothetical protein
MELNKSFYIHSRGGKIGATDVSSSQDVDSIVTQASADPRKHLILHFHGGLVSKTAGLEIAQRLSERYQNAGHPIFFVWESGAFEAIRNNIKELAHEPVFKQLIRKLLEYALQRLGGTNGARSFAPAATNVEEVRATLNHFYANPAPDTIPYKGFVPFSGETQARAATLGISTEEIEIDLQADPEFLAALASLPDIPPGMRNALLPAPVVERRSLFSEVASEKLSEAPGRRGFVTTFKAAWLLKDILKNVLIRYRNGRDHGLYATIVEEIARNFKLSGSNLNEWGKALQWNRMKQDCDDAFGDDRNLYAGTALLARLSDRCDRGLHFKRITLIGHSTGAIYICSLLDAAARHFDASVQFDIVFLAPAISHESFAKALGKHKSRIRNFRMFAMKDEWEREDQVWGDDHALDEGRDLRRYIYPSSLLYLVSGILESRTYPDGSVRDEADVPILGVERFLAWKAVYPDSDFPEVGAVRNWLGTHASPAVWSLDDNVNPGMSCGSKDHGYFDNDAATLRSLSHILEQSF